MYAHSDDAPAYFEPGEINKLLDVMLERLHTLAEGDPSAQALQTLINLIELSYMTGLDPILCWSLTREHVTVARERLKPFQARLQVGGQVYPTGVVAAELLLGLLYEAETKDPESYVLNPAVGRIKGWAEMEAEFDSARKAAKLEEDELHPSRSLLDLPASAVMRVAVDEHFVREGGGVLDASTLDQADLEALILDANEVRREEGLSLVSLRLPR